MKRNSSRDPLLFPAMTLPRFNRHMLGAEIKVINGKDHITIASVDVDQFE